MLNFLIRWKPLEPENIDFLNHLVLEDTFNIKVFS